MQTMEKNVIFLSSVYCVERLPEPARVNDWALNVNPPRFVLWLLFLPKWLSEIEPSDRHCMEFDLKLNDIESMPMVLLDCRRSFCHRWDVKRIWELRVAG